MANERAQQIGKVVQIIGPVVDVEFSGNYLPSIHQALRVTSEGFDVNETIDVVVEVQHHLGEGRVRAVSMLPTDGMVRGMKVVDTGGPITVPVGNATLGRVMNVIGDPIDELGPGQVGLDPQVQELEQEDEDDQEQEDEKPEDEPTEVSVVVGVELLS